MLILCDFDGTITLSDVTNLIWDHFSGRGWRDELLPPYARGEISHLDIMTLGFKAVSTPEDEMLAYAKANIGMRPGFDELRAFCAEKGWPFYVVSGGIDTYIKAFLPPEITFFSYHAELDGYWKITLPEGVTLAEGQDFKVYVLEKLRQEHPGMEMVFIGDGRNDLPVSLHADRVFVVKDTRLGRLLSDKGVAFTEFTHFEEVVGGLK